MDNETPSNCTVNRFEKPLMFLILVVAAVMRCYHLGEISLSNDELSALFRANHPTFSEMIAKGVLIDYHPAGVEVFVYYWIKAFGTGVFIYRLPFVVLSLFSVYLIYRIGKKWFNAATGLWTAALFAVLEYPLLYSMLARMYSPGLFFSLLAVFYWTDWMNAARHSSSVSSRTQWGLFMAIALGVHTHYFTVAFLFSVVFSGLFLLHRRDWLRYLSCCGSASLTFLLEWRIFLEQMKTGDLGGWLGKPEPTFLRDFFFNFLNDSRFLFILFALLFVSGLVIGIRSLRLNRYHLLGAVWFVFSFSLAYLYSVYRHPALQYSTLLFCMPFLVMSVIGLVPVGTLSDRTVLIVALILISTGAYSTVKERRYYTYPPFGVFKEVAGAISGWAGQYGEKNTAALVNVITPDYINYYFEKADHLPSCIRFKVESPEDLAKFREYVDSLTLTTPYFAYGWTNNLHPYEILSIIRSNYPGVRDYRSYFNAESWLFSKDSTNQDTSLIHRWDFDFEDAAYGELIHEDSVPVSGRRVAVLTDHIEYSPGLDCQVKLDAKKFAVFSCSIWYRCADTTGLQAVVFEVIEEGKSLDWYSMPIKPFNLHPGQWQQVFLARPLPQVEGTVQVKAYVWNPDHKTFAVDKMVAKLENAIDPYSRK